MAELSRRLVAEALGTGLLVATVIGSGIMAERLTEDSALALLANTLPTSAILVVLVTVLGPLSGAHLNPAVSLVMALRRALPGGETVLYVLSQLIGAVLGTMLANAMFALPLLEASQHVRTGPNQWLAEAVAIARSMTNTFSGIRPADLPGFIAAELCGAVVALIFMNWLLRGSGEAAKTREAQP